MARPVKVAPPVFTLPSGLAGFVAASDPSASESGQLPASVTGAFDHLRHTLGRTVPHNVTEAKASARRLRTLG